MRGWAIVGGPKDRDEGGPEAIAPGHGLAANLGDTPAPGAEPNGPARAPQATPTDAAQAEALETNPAPVPDSGPITEETRRVSTEEVATAEAERTEPTAIDVAPPLNRQERLEISGAALAEAAATLLGEAPTALPAPGNPPAGDDAPLTFADGCARLGITPYILRRLLDDYEDILPPLVEVGTERRMSPLVLDMLAAIVRWRGEGLGHDEIVRRVRAGGAAPDDDADGQAVDRLVGELGRMHQELQRSEARRAEDRDRLLTALMRNSQELQHLRYEMAAGKSRKERRKGFWSRLFRL